MTERSNYDVILDTMGDLPGSFTLSSTGDNFLAILTIDNGHKLNILASGTGYTADQAINEMLDEVREIYSGKT